MLGELEEIADIEKMNFVAWYRDATVEEIAIARRNNAAKLDELKKKYAAEIELMDIVGRRIDKKTACDIAIKNATGTL